MSALHLVSSPTPNDRLAAPARAAALLGDTPTLTLSADPNAPDSCCSVRFVRHHAVWLGIISDNAIFADRVRMGMVPRFVKGDADVVAVAGIARVRLLGRVAEASADLAAAVASLLGPWDPSNAILLEVVPDALVVVDDDNNPGAIPRT